MNIRFDALLVCVIASYFNQGCAHASQNFGKLLAEQAILRTHNSVKYDASYREIGYPNGDVPENFGVCADVIIRSYRKMGIDLQTLVHEDMKKNFSAYPNYWGHRSPDKNIDHRRVPILKKFFERHGEILKLNDEESSLKAGDIIVWSKTGIPDHIGIVVSADVNGPSVVHNQGNGIEVSKGALKWPVVGHYRFQKLDSDPQR